jgi:hypothetical protein
MMRKKVIALLAVASVGLVMPTMALARGGGGGGGGATEVAAWAAASVPGWPAATGMVVSVAADSTTMMVVVSAIATSGTAFDSDSHTVTMTTTLTMTRMALIRMSLAPILSAISSGLKRPSHHKFVRIRFGKHESKFT